jgi:hypothetical protein
MLSNKPCCASNCYGIYFSIHVVDVSCISVIRQYLVEGSALKTYHPIGGYIGVVE